MSEIGKKEITALTEQEIHSMLQKAKELFCLPEKASFLTEEKPLDYTLVNSILRGSLQVTLKRKTEGFRKDILRFSEVARCGTESMFTVITEAILGADCERVFFHTLLFTYNDDGIRNPVGIGEAVEQSGRAVLRNVCHVRKANVQSRNMGAMCTVLKLEQRDCYAYSKLIFLEEPWKSVYKEIREWRYLN